VGNIHKYVQEHRKFIVALGDTRTQADHIHFFLAGLPVGLAADCRAWAIAHPGVTIQDYLNFAGHQFEEPQVKLALAQEGYLGSDGKRARAPQVSSTAESGHTKRPRPSGTYPPGPPRGGGGRSSYPQASGSRYQGSSFQHLPPPPPRNVRGPPPQQPREDFLPDGTPICGYCHAPGHIKRNCPGKAESDARRAQGGR
jgi:hypothetical protein